MFDIQLNAYVDGIESLRYRVIVKFEDHVSNQEAIDRCRRTANILLDPCVGQVQIRDANGISLTPVMSLERE